MAPRYWTRTPPPLGAADAAKLDEDKVILARRQVGSAGRPGGLPRFRSNSTSGTRGDLTSLPDSTIAIRYSSSPDTATKRAMADILSEGPRIDQVVFQGEIIPAAAHDVAQCVDTPVTSA